MVYGHYSQDCTDNGDLRAGEHLSGWAPGVDDMVLPNDVGVRIGGSGGYMSFGLDIHYDKYPRTRGLEPRTDPDQSRLPLC